MQDNHPDLWRSALKPPTLNTHKYERGLALVYGAPELTGATRLAASACARIGAGLVTVLSPPAAVDIYRASLPAHIMVREDLEWFDPRATVRLYGSGGLPKGVKIRLDRPVVLDADALRSLPDTLHERCVLTPHEGEFGRAFPEIVGARSDQALSAASKTGAIIVLKGAQTVIAHPDGRCVLNAHASPYLATAGSGDVLAGMIAGLLAQGLPSFEAACAAVWMHGDTALKFGPGLVASDLIEGIAVVLKEVLGISAQVR
jgi:NAD(P)H-hydrate repair Nnr-like enzyme with NAD(P)H-hydrate dehydratase domain